MTQQIDAIISQPRNLNVVMKDNQAPSDAAVCARLVELSKQRISSKFPASHLTVKLGPDNLPGMKELDVDINNVRRQVLTENNYWERIHVTFIFVTPSNEKAHLRSIISGTFAPGMGAIVPSDSQFISFEPEYKGQLTAFQNGLEDDLQSFIDEKFDAAGPRQVIVKTPVMSSKSCNDLREFASHHADLGIDVSPCNALQFGDKISPTGAPAATK